LTGNSIGQLPSAIKGTGPLAGPPESNSLPLPYWSCVALADALLLLVVVVVVLLGDALLVVGDTLLVVVVEGDTVEVSWAAAGVLGCISVSQFRRNVKPASSTSTITAIFNEVVLAMMGSVAA
jgi:hypothetical protein